MTVDLQALKEKMGAVKDELRRAGGQAIREAAEELFKEYPQLESFGWTQYAPYFNDGEACIFKANTDIYSIFINGERLDQYPDYLDGKYVSSYYDGNSWTPSYLKSERLSDDEVSWVCLVARTVSDIIEPLTDDDYYAADDTLKSLFGDGLVTITRTGIEVEEYEHD